MKNHFFLVQLMMLIIATNICFGQPENSITVRQVNDLSKQVQVSYQKTVSLVFPATIKTVDRGSEDLLVKKPSGVQNVLKVKAARADFEETNLSVITADGILYSFTVIYNNQPPVIIINVTSQNETTQNVSGTLNAAFKSVADEETVIHGLEVAALHSKRNIRKVKDESYEVRASVKGLYTAHDLFFYKLKLFNGSNIDYNIEAIHFFIEDKKKAKRTATQELALIPIAVMGNHETVLAKHSETVVITLPKQMIAKDKQLLIEIEEKNGGRKLVCKLTNSTLLKAKSLKLTK